MAMEMMATATPAAIRIISPTHSPEAVIVQLLRTPCQRRYQPRYDQCTDLTAHITPSNRQPLQISRQRWMRSHDMMFHNFWSRRLVPHDRSSQEKDICIITEDAYPNTLIILKSHTRDSYSSIELK